MQYNHANNHMRSQGQEKGKRNYQTNGLVLLVWKVYLSLTCIQVEMTLHIFHLKRFHVPEHLISKATLAGISMIPYCRSEFAFMSSTFFVNTTKDYTQTFVQIFIFSEFEFLLP